MEIIQTVFNILGTTLFLILAVVWSCKDYPNLMLKVLLIFLAVAGVTLILYYNLGILIKY